MPTVFNSDGYRFFFYSNEGTEPCHIHVQGQGGEMKIWIATLTVADAYGLSAKQQRKVVELVRTHQGMIREAWNEHFSNR